MTKIDATNVDNYLSDIGATGNAKIERGGLYTQREENCDWRFCGAVAEADEMDVQLAIGAHFEAVN